MRPFNLEQSTNLRELNPYGKTAKLVAVAVFALILTFCGVCSIDVDKLVSVKGLVTRASNVIPDIKEGFFKCSLCDFTITAGIEKGRITEPDRCQKCHSLHSMNLVHNRCKFADKQIIRLQETPGLLFCYFEHLSWSTDSFHPLLWPSSKTLFLMVKPLTL